MSGITPDGDVNWDGPPSNADLGIDFDLVPLTQRERRAIFRGLHLLALLVDRIDADTGREETPQKLRHLARVVLPEGLGVELEEGE